jgi:dihydroxy-acid dehydratase
MVGHVAPEAINGGPIALVEEGDMITIDLDQRRIDLEVPQETLDQRRATWTPPEPNYKTGVFAKYIKTVSSAAQGAVTSGV